MNAAVYSAFRGPITVQTLPDPEPPPDGVVLGVRANGICRSDWHGWMGHDPDIALPHVPGHEMAGVIEAVGRDVTRWSVGDRVAVPFIAGCSRCPQCLAGHPQVCDDQFQPGFHGWGGFAQRVALHRADATLVALPASLDFVAAASLGCRFATSFRAVTQQGRVQAGEWVSVHGCGGVGLAAVQIARAVGARVVAVDVAPSPLSMARKVGAEHALDAGQVGDVAGAIADLTDGGVHVAIDALGHSDCVRDGIGALRTRGRFVQVGLLPDGPVPVPLDRVIARELVIVGSHGLAAHDYGRLLDLVASGAVDPAALVTRRLTLEQGAALLCELDGAGLGGMAVIDRFSSI
ncbi:MAG: zinc-dependent alcohol dehydrogenase family protein [Myxococcales bacterium]|nr:zinc-dependent alcohol dehydrogenase family protein [Myxococcales bacterium]